MSITVLHQSATIGGLRDQGTPARALTQPPCRLRGIDVELAGAGGNSSGVWECESGRFERQLPNAEVMQILTGACTVTPTDGVPWRSVRAIRCSFRRSPRANGMCTRPCARSSS